MRIGLLCLLMVILPGLAWSETMKIEKPADYCYKPNKPLLFSTQEYQRRYQEDLKEYERCVKYFTEVYNNISKRQADSEKHARRMLNEFVKQQP